MQSRYLIREIIEKSLTTGFVDDSDLLQPTNGAPGVGQFRTFGIVNRAAIPDITKNLKVHLGIERIPVQRIVRLQNERGPDGEQVFGVEGDNNNLIRLVGNWQSISGTEGFPIESAAIASVDEYIEIVFYGTGLNVIYNVDNNNRDLRATVDGGSEGSNIIPNGTDALTARNYRTNQTVIVASGLTLGLHTIKLRDATASARAKFYGFEIVNQNSTLIVNPGKAYKGQTKLRLVSQQTLAFNSGFESGSLGTSGGRVVAYLKSDGTIGKAANPAGATQLNMSGADHSNEEMVRKYHWREFGAGGTINDFSTLITSGSARAFTLEDGITALCVGTNANTSIGAFGGPYSNFAPENADALYLGNPEGVTFTFVGTGLDVEFICGSPEIETYQFIINGVTIAASQTLTNVQASRKIVKVVSGLPYGTHTFKMTRSVSLTSNMGILSFLVYQPKKPSIPSNAIELADYNVMANYVASPSLAPHVLAMANGVLRKSSAREWVYSHNGSFAVIGIDLPVSANGNYVGVNSQTVSGGYGEITFFGTGFEFRGGNAPGYANINLVSLQSGSGSLLPLTSANFPTAAASYSGNGSFNLATGAYSQAGAASADILRISNLPLGFYKVRFTNNSSTSGLYLQFNAIDIITPVHVQKSNMSEIQNSLPIGNCALADSRILLSAMVQTEEKYRASAVDSVSNPSTSSTTFVPLPDMTLPVKSKGAWFEFNYSASLINGAGAAEETRLYINSVAVGTPRQVGNSASVHFLTADSIQMYLPPGTHIVQLFWRAISSSVTSTNRSMSVKEL